MYSTQICPAKLNPLAISTNTNVKAHLDEAVILFVGAEFKVVELQLEHRCRHDHKNPKIVADLAKLQEQLGLKFSIHAPYMKVDLASNNELTRHKSIEAIIETFDFCQALNASMITTHTGLVNGSALANLEKSLSILVKEGAKQDLHISLETAGRKGVFVTLSTDEYKQLCQTTGCSLTLDLPHLLHIYEEGFLKEMTELLPYAKNLHIADCFGTNHQHFPLGHGDFPYSEVWKILKSSGYQGQITVDAMNGGFSPIKYLQQAVNFREFYSDFLV